MSLGQHQTLRRLVARRAVGAYRSIHAVKDVSFTVDKGEAVGLIGRNGSSKSTLFEPLRAFAPDLRFGLGIFGAVLLGVRCAQAGWWTPQH